VDFLKNLTVDNYNLSFEEIEKILGEKLPPSAYQYDAWWSNNPSHPLMREILEAGWRKEKVDFNIGEVWLKRVQNQLTFEQLRNFILNKMILRANYQPLMIKTLLEAQDYVVEKDFMVEVFRNNNKDKTRDYNQIVSDVYLEVLGEAQHNIIKFNQQNRKYELNIDRKFNEIQRAELIHLCMQKIQELNEDKIAICWPTDRDDEKIDSFSAIAKIKGKALWGVNWKAPRIQKSDFPIKGYIYYRQKIIAVANITDITDYDDTPQEELSLKPDSVDYTLNRYSTFLHLKNLQRCEPFDHTMLELMDEEKEIPAIVQQRVYVKELPDSKIEFFTNAWIWSVTAENWGIVKTRKIWASKIPENIRTRVRPGDKVIFYVLGTGEFQGIYEFDGEWYDAKEPIWADETRTVIYRSQIKLKPIKLGHVNIYRIAPKLKFIPRPEERRIVNLALKGGAGYPSNNGKPISYEDYLTILTAMSTELNDEEVNYWKISPGSNGEDWENQRRNGVIGIRFLDFGDLTGMTENELKEKIRQEYGNDESDSKISNTFMQMRDFLKIKEGDIIVANGGKSKILGIGRVVGPYKYRKEMKHPHTFPVDWYDTTSGTIPKEEGWMITIVQLDKEKFDELMEFKTNYLLLRYNSDRDNKWDNDNLGKTYHYGKIANYTKITKGTKTIWFDRNNGDFYFWGHGEVNNVEEDADGEFLAHLDGFEFFNKQSESSQIVPLKARQSIDEKIKSLPGWNIQSSILEINKEIYDEIVGLENQLNSLEDIPLRIPSDSELQEGIKKIQEQLLINSNTIREIVLNLASHRHILLAGPIGTGKTQLAKLIPEIIWKDDGYYSEIHTATADWNTQDVIGGIVPRMKGEQVTYDIQYGCVADTILQNWSKDGKNRVSQTRDGKSTRGTWLVIDEFNRADIDKAFGQLFTSLETKMVRIPISNGTGSAELQIPQDYRIIGTLNTADKHYLFKLSDALKRRFAYIEVLPPNRHQKDDEIFYALKNAMSEMHNEDFSTVVVLDEQTKKINEEKSNKEIIQDIKIAYDVLDLIRFTKPLGTAILKSIYQTILVGTKLTNDHNEILNSALNTNLVTQLENLPNTSLETILQVLFGNPIEFFENIHNKDQTKERYKDDFNAFLSFIGASNTDDRLQQFVLGKMDTSRWDSIKKSYEETKAKINLPLSLQSFKKSIEDLKKSTLV